MAGGNASKRIINAIIDSGTIQAGDVVVVGVSGGPDSLCLLHALYELSDSMDLRLHAVHINHMLRGEKAYEEAERVEEFCERRGILCSTFELDCKEYAEEAGVSCEEAGRIVRYEVFDEAAAMIEEPGDKIKIAIAHNSDDQAETLVFRLMRGSGTHGVGGIKAERESAKGYNVVRPLLGVSRREIEEYIAENKLSPNIDESNSVADVSRNKIRLELIPYMEKNFNPNVKEALIRYAELAADDDALLYEYAFNEGEKFVYIDEDRDVLVIDVSGVRNMRNPLLSRLLFSALASTFIEGDIGYEHINSIIRLIRGGNPSAAVDLPGGFVAAREYGELIIGSRENVMQCTDATAEKYELVIKVLKRNEFEASIDRGYYAAFDFDSFNAVYPGKAGELCVRTRRPGDYIAIKGGRKKIQDYLVDAKIKKTERDSVLLAAIGSEVLWVVSTKKYSHNYQINAGTERVLFLELSETI